MQINSTVVFLGEYMYDNTYSIYTGITGMQNACGWTPTSFIDSAPSPLSDPWHGVSSKVSDWRSGNATRVRRMLRDMVTQATRKVVICVEEMHKLQLRYISNQNNNNNNNNKDSFSCSFS